jgi:hypothetical protein
MSMDFIAVLEYEQLDNGLFLTSFARALARRKKRGIILHGDSEYTDRLIQTGMMREDARVRAIKDLNHRLIALFADQGVSAIGLNGYQKSMIRLAGSDIEINKEMIEALPGHPMLLISNLIESSGDTNMAAVPLSRLSAVLQKLFDVDDLVLFTIHEASSVIKDELPTRLCPSAAGSEFRNRHVPEGFRDSGSEVLLTTPEAFGNG